MPFHNTECQSTQVDVAFLLDSSGSIESSGEHNYQIMKDFIKGIVRSFVIGPDDTTVAVATFSSKSKFKIHFDFTKYTTTADIVDAIQNIPFIFVNLFWSRKKNFTWSYHKRFVVAQAVCTCFCFKGEKGNKKK